MIAEKFYKYYLIFIILAGVFFSWWIVLRIENDMRESLIWESKMMAKSISPLRIKSLTGSFSDTALADYKRLKEQLIDVASAHDKYRFISLVGYKDNSNYFLYLDSELPDSKDYSPPGEFFNSFPKDYYLLFKDKNADIFGPADTKWGKLVTASVPITDARTNQTIAVLDIDVDARDWNISLLRKSILPIGMLVALIITLISIFNLRLKSRALRQSEERFRNIFESFEDLYFQTDLSGIIKILSPSVIKLSGWTVDELIGKPVNKIYSNIEDRAKLLDAIFKTGFVRDYEIELLKKDGSKAFATISANLIFNGKNQTVGINGTVRDITERKSAEEKLIKYSEDLVESNAQKDKFFSIIAHDLRGPLASLLNFLQFLSEEYDEITEEEKKEHIGHLFNSAKNVFKLLENLLEWSVIQRGLIDFNPEPIVFNSLCSNIISHLSESAQTKQISINLNSDNNIEIFADPYMMNVIVRNLLSNAIKFTRRGGTINISCEKANSGYEISISDNGIGIPNDMIHCLFKIGEKTNRPGTENEKSTGLGLLLCKEYVEKHNGNIRVESVEGKGSKFIFSIPVE